MFKTHNKTSNKFLTLEEENGCNVTFGDNASINIVGISVVSLDNRMIKN